MKQQSTKNLETTHGFTLVEIMIVMTVIGLLAAIAIPNFIRTRSTSQQNICISNLRQIDSAIQEWALENNQAPNSAVSEADITSYLGRGTAASLNAIHCPADPTSQFGNSYKITDSSTKPLCQILPGPGFGTHEIN